MSFLLNFLSIICPFYEISFLRNVLYMKCSFYKMSFLWNVLSSYEMSYCHMKCPIVIWNVLSSYEMSYRHMKCPIVIWNVLSSLIVLLCSNTRFLHDNTDQTTSVFVLSFNEEMSSWILKFVIIITVKGLTILRVNIS